MKTATLFFVLAMMSMVFGSFEMGGLSVDLGQTLMIVFLLISIIAFVSSQFARKSELSH